MHANLLPSVAELSASALDLSIRSACSDSRSSELGIFWRLAEADHRQTFAELGFSSIWSYCVDHLRMSNGTAGRRIAVARLLRRFPSAAPFLSDGRLNPSTFEALKEVLTPENCEELFCAASDLSEEKVDQLVASLRPRPHVRDTVRSVRVAIPPAFTPTLGVTDAASLPPLDTESAVAPPRLSPPRVKPLDGQFVSLTFTVSNEFMADLAQVSAAVSHVVTDGNKEAVLRECIRRTLESVARSRGGLPARRPYADVTTEARSCNALVAVNDDRSNSALVAANDARSKSALDAATDAGGTNGNCPHSASETTLPSTQSRSLALSASQSAHASADTFTPTLGVDDAANDDSLDNVPISLARQVWSRDEGCCSFVAENGRRCSSVWQLEIHHRFAKGLGGKATLANLTLHCRVHNLLRARQDFGDAHMLQFSRRRS